MRKAISLILIVSILSLTLYFILKNEDRNMNSSIVVAIKIEYLNCHSYRGSSQSLIKFFYNDKNYNLKIRKSTCKKIKVNDSLEVLYFKEVDKFYEKLE